MDGIGQHRACGLAAIETLSALLRWRVEDTPFAEAYRHFDPHRQLWVSLTWQDFGHLAERWARALDHEGLDHGDRIAILMPNGVEHVAMDQAALSRGLVPVPLHAIDNPESIVYILEDSGAALLLIDSLDRWRKLASLDGRANALKRIVCATGGASVDAGDGRIIALDRWLDIAPSQTAGTVRATTVKPGDLAAIVYTSGTTGRPKGVMLSHANVMANVKAIHRRVPAAEGDVFLSFLPLSHTFERTAGYYYQIAVGACVAYARSVAQLAQDLKTVRPTVLVSVPRIYERFYARIMEQRDSASRLQRAALDLTLKIGSRRFEARQGRTHLASVVDRLAWPIVKRLVADRISAELGGRLRVAVSGGAPIAEPIVRLFLSLGLDVLQGYGMTETSPVVAVNTPDDNDPRSVGSPLDGIEVRIGADDELLVRGPSVMVGYWRKPEETRRVIEADGWLHTGDQARIEAGRLYITGRIKDIIVTSTGEKIAPVDLETAITSDPLFEQAMVVGELRPYLAALVVVNANEWASEKARLGNEADAGGVPSPGRQAAFLLKRIAEAVKDFPAYATPRTVWWTTEPWTIGDGLLTPTLKVKRIAMAERFAAQIDALYARKLPQTAT
ncbi:MAG: long-chain fatty acid--CoA ligase [Hyphomicrobiaceae bacterium]|nr:long-chain fatty acid--CoA ligase [Hyphomicrobiaceae bacterium]